MTKTNYYVEINPIGSDKISQGDIFGALMSACGARVGDMPDNPDGDKAFTKKWEWFDPIAMTEDDYEDLPEHWQTLVRNQNQECWNLKYKYIHSPVPILCSYPRVPLRGIFGVDENCTPETVTAKDLIHLAGQFTEYDTKDKCIWQKNLRQIAEELSESE